MKNYDLSRFVIKHKTDYPVALAEIKAGKKQSHWIWYIFPQIKGLPVQSANSHTYAIVDIEEARQFLADPYLGANLLEICNALLELDSDNPYEVMGGGTDARKLCSSMTLFSLADENQPVFKAVLDKFFHGRTDRETIGILEKSNTL